MVCHQQASSHEIDYFSSVTISTSMQRCSSPSHVVADIWSHWLQLPLKVYLLTYCFTYLQLTTYGALWLFAVQHHKIIYFIVIYFKIYQSTAWNSKNNMHHINTIPELNGQCRDSPFKHGQHKMITIEECGVTPQSIPEFPLRHSSKFNKIKIHTHTLYFSTDFVYFIFIHFIFIKS